MRNYTQQYINGEWIDSESNETIDVINPQQKKLLEKLQKVMKRRRKAVQAAYI